MAYEYDLTFKDYLSAQKLYRHHRKWPQVTYLFWVWILLSFGILALVGIAFPTKSDNISPWTSWVLIAVWFAIGIPLFRVYQLRKCWKALNPTKAKSISAELEWNNEQIISSVKNRSEGRFFWSTICDYAEDEKIVLIFIRKKQFLFIPREALNEVTWKELRMLISTNGSPSC